MVLMGDPSFSFTTFAWLPESTDAPFYAWLSTKDPSDAGASKPFPTDASMFGIQVTSSTIAPSSPSVPVIFLAVASK